MLNKKIQIEDIPYELLKQDLDLERRPDDDEEYDYEVEEDEDEEWEEAEVTKSYLLEDTDFIRMQSIDKTSGIKRRMQVDESRLQSNYYSPVWISLSKNYTNGENDSPGWGDIFEAGL